MYESLREQFHYYMEHQDKFVERYNGQVIVLKDFEVIGAYPDYARAWHRTIEKHEPGTFIVQLVTPGTEAYTVTIASNFVLKDAA